MVANYNSVLRDMVQSYRLDMSEIYDEDDFKNKLESFDTRNTISKELRKGMEKSDIYKKEVDDNIDTENKRIEKKVSGAKDREELEVVTDELKSTSPKIEIFGDKITEQKMKKARQLAPIEKRQIRKQQFLENPVEEIRLGNYRRWSAVQRFYNLTDDEVIDLQRRYPEIDIR